MAYNAEHWIRWASLAGQHAFFWYLVILVFLLIGFAAGWWFWHRFLAGNHLKQPSPMGRMGLHSALVLAVIMVCSWVFVELAEGLGMQRTMGLADQALADAIHLGSPKLILQAFATITRLGDKIGRAHV